jgi:outer membrane receptor protein involved in Fe transport
MRPAIRAGGASSRTQNYQPFDPEDVKSYEVGAKTDFWDHKARLNVAGYIMDRKNSQVDISSIQFTTATSFNNLVTINAPGNTKIRGIEADLTVRPITGLTLNAGYAYTYTKIPLVPITSRAAASPRSSISNSTSSSRRATPRRRDRLCAAGRRRRRQGEASTSTAIIRRPLRLRSVSPPRPMPRRSSTAGSRWPISRWVTAARS